jgi:hypothetical protein
MNRALGEDIMRVYRLPFSSFVAGNIFEKQKNL